MHMVFLIAAAVGCTLLAAQIAMQLLGLGGDHDFHDGHVDADMHADAGESNAFFGVLSFKTLTAFLAFFGLAGLACGELGLSSRPLVLLLSTLAGLSAGAVVLFLMRLLSRLQATGTVDLDAAVGRTARVYLSIPGGSGSPGKITVEIGGQERELLAITPGEAVETGARVEIVRRVEGQTFEVIKL